MAADTDANDTFPIGSLWKAKDTGPNTAQDIPEGLEFRIAFKCENFISIYATSHMWPRNFKVPRSAFGLNFERDYSRAVNSGYAKNAHESNAYVTDVSKLRR
jgi:hypothetical protein